MIKYNHIRASQPRVHVIAFYPYPETNPDTQYDQDYHYKSLIYTYGINCQVVYAPEEVINLPDLPLIALEEPNNATVDLREFTHPADAIYVVGNSRYPNPSDYFKADHRVSLATPGGTGHPLYGDQVMAIVLQDRCHLTQNLQISL